MKVPQKNPGTEKVNADYFKTPTRPVLDGEPSYEQIPQGFHKPEEPYWQDHHVRRYAYWSALAGAVGHVYGHNSIIQFYGTGGEAVYGVKETWEKSIHDSMKCLKVLLENSDFTYSFPAQEIVADPSGSSQEENLLALSNEKYILCYSYSGRAIVFNEKVADFYDGYWVDPLCGSRSYFGSFEIKNATFSPPNKKTSWNDWVLFLELIKS